MVIEVEGAVVQWLVEKMIIIWGASVGYHESFVEIHSYESSVMSVWNFESNLQRFTNLERFTNL